MCGLHGQKDEECALTVMSGFILFFWIFAVCLHCVPVLLPSLIFPPHLLCIRLVSTAQFPVFSPANQLLHLIALT